jgi:hypothetical protein
LSGVLTDNKGLHGFAATVLNQVLAAISNMRTMHQAVLGVLTQFLVSRLALL